MFAAAALVLTALLLAFKEPVLTMLDTPAESFALTDTYVTICGLGTIFICGYNAISAVLRGYGDSARPMAFVGLACALNIALDMVFVKYLAMGGAGTALATVLSQAFSMAASVVYLKRARFIFDFKLKSFRPVGALAKELARVGIPISFQEMLIRISFLYLTAVMNRCGVYAAAVVGIGSKYDVFAMLTATSMANALAAFTAQNMGAGKRERARASLWYGLGFALSVSLLFWGFAQWHPDRMIRVFSDDPHVIAAGVPFFRSCSYDYVLVTIVFCLNGYLNGRQKTVWTMMSSAAGALALRIPLVYLFGRYFADDLGMLGSIAPAVSGIMACYTLFYVWHEGRGHEERRAVSNR